MSNDHLRQRRPDRRYRRLLPAAVAAVTIAASAPFVTPASARAADAPQPIPRERVRPATTERIPALLNARALRAPKVQTNSAT
jgi:hypothetical protein